jgi:hypothetical protein
MTIAETDRFRSLERTEKCESGRSDHNRFVAPEEGGSGICRRVRVVQATLLRAVFSVLFGCIGKPVMRRLPRELPSMPDFVTGWADNPRWTDNPRCPDGRPL